ncbi:MAG TPA: LPS export ABC transporter permease LptF [Verrucomicrobiae bacterium]|nr:LPS export ABC transporter permease LptF [Verrucomicrobiae bacterium]
MRAPLLERYLLREAVTSWAGVTVVLLAIMLSTRFARFLAQAAAGELPREFLLNVVALSSLQYLVILIPVSLLLAVLLALGRMYRDHEIAAMTGCGIGPGAMYRPIALLAALLAVITAALALEVGPWAGRRADFMFKDAQRSIQFTPFEPGRFKEVAGGRAVFYAAQVDRTGTLDTIFARLAEKRGASFVTAQRGTQDLDRTTGDRVLTLENGYRYAGEPGRADFEIVRFDTLVTRVAPPPMLQLSSKRKIRETAALVGSSDREDQAELQWRIAAPVSVLLLALIAVPLAHTNPRAGRYGKLVLGILLYLGYSNLLALAQAWVAKGYLPPVPAMWGVHLVAASLGLIMVARRLGWHVGAGTR